MTRQKLFEKSVILTEQIVSDPRWETHKDDLGVTILGMLLYGYTLTTGRVFMMLELEDVDAVVERCLTTRVGAAQQWTKGLVEEASLSAFNPEHHPVHYELVGIGQSYCETDDPKVVTQNVFDNLENIRRRLHEDSDEDA